MVTQKYLHHKALIWLIAASFLLCLAIAAVVINARARQSFASSPVTWYVSKNGNNSGGTSWANAWDELDQINWSVIHPGDTILLDGGSTSMTYTTHISVDASGSSGAPITIQRATEAGHNGTVVFFGGNSTILPYCGQTSTWTESPGTVSDAIDWNGNSWLTFEGNSWDGIQIHGYFYKTINFTGGESNITMRNVEAYDNGIGVLSGGTWSPDHPAVELAGVTSNLTFDRMDFHDNGQDNFQGSGGVNNFTVTNSWLHETRTIPGIPSEAFNLCSHNDGFQLFGSTPSNGITFNNDVLGPGLTNGVIFQPQITNLTMQNVLILDPGSNATITNSGASANWIIDHVTSIGQSDNLTFEGSGNTVTNSILYDGLLLLNDSVASSSNNCTFGTTAAQGTINGQNVDPQFETDLSSYPNHTTDITQYPDLSVLENGDFSVKSGSPCSSLGSSITSVAGFLSIVGGSSSPATNPSPSPVPSPVPSSSNTTSNNQAQPQSSGTLRSSSPTAHIAPSASPQSNNAVTNSGLSSQTSDNSKVRTVINQPEHRTASILWRIVSAGIAMLVGALAVVLAIDAFFFRSTLHHRLVSLFLKIASHIHIG